MTTETSIRTCAHASCSCEVPAGQTYCSPYCANAAVDAAPESGSPDCGCGHPQCGAETPSPRS